MVSLRPHYKITVTTTMELNEAEMGALDALAGYGIDSFLKVFYDRLGKAYLQPYEAGLRSLFEKIRKEIPPALSKVEQARKAIEKRR